MNVNVPLTKPQRDFVFSDATNIALCGGLGSGKTRAGTMRAVLLLLGDPGINVGMFLPTYDLLKLRAMPGVEEDLSMLGIDYKINKADFRIDIPDYGYIIFRSYDNPTRIVSFEIAHAIIDELDTLRKDDAALVYRKISERTRQACKGPNTIGVVSTPDSGVNGYMYENWVKKQRKGYALYKAPTISNPYLPEGYVDQIRANYDPILADLYLNGEFVSLSQNKVYHFFDRKKHCSDRVITDQDTVLHVGLDFNIGGCCATTFVIDKENPIAVDEFISHDTQDFCHNLTRYKGKKIIVYPDASGTKGSTNSSASDIAIIRQAGFQLRHNDSNPAVRDRINAYNGLLSHDRFRINTDKCPNLTNALETQGYTKKGEPEKWDDHPAIDDWCDCSGYFIAYKYPVLRNTVTSHSAW